MNKPSTSKRALGPLLPWIMCIIAAIFYGYEFYLRVAPTVMVNDLMHLYSITALSLGGLTAFYYYAYTPMQVLVGTLMDHYDIRKLMTAASLCCALGAFAFGAGHALWLAQLGQLIMGFGSAFAFVGVMKLAADWLPGRYFALVSGLTTTLGMLGAISGEVALSSIVSKIGTQQSLYYAGYAGILLAVIMWLVVRDRFKTGPIKPAKKEISNLVSMLWVVAKNRQIWLNGAIGSLIFMPTTLFAVFWGMPYLENVRGFSKIHAAYLTSMIFWGWVVGSPLMGWITNVIKRRRLPMMVGGLIAGAILATIIYLPITDYSHLTILMFAFGVFSSAEILVFAVAHDITRTDLSGTAVALTNMIVSLSGILHPLIGWLLDLSWDGTLVNHIPHYSEHDFRLALFILPAGLLLAFILSFWLKETYCEQHPNQA